MSDLSSERLKAAVLALYQARPVEGPPGDDGQRSVWHLSTQGAELLSFVDPEGRVQRQELTLLDEHCVWSSGVGLRTGRVEQDGAVRTETSVVHPDAQPVPARLLRAALALEHYQGEDRYIQHIQRVLALARQGLVLSGGTGAVAVAPAAPAPVSPTPPVSASASASAAPASTSHSASAGAQTPLPLQLPVVDPVMLQRQKTEGLTMLVVLGLGLLLSVWLLFWLL
ncbi:hypothetical protein BO221_12035 [Archangium sp. Cb G35]|uniref:hypothetical protein n=1 Tax=Archangium sp. Cb G35 TaxID=1920190 RepID=UPI0009379172|nr:hypothetical protein [Archangium sp. Cb G35]OJT25101.1 hypothetical protein BO221_12035 [Archangium sp. Cb G35]